MRIKQPDSDNALQSLFEQLDFVQDKLNNCVAKGHDAIAVVYVSTLIMAPNVAYNGEKILDKIAGLANISPNCICLVRTTAPNVFAKTPFLRKLQQKSTNYLRNRCYVVLYSRRREFLNHAKFLLHFHICFSEGIVHCGNFYGSTNLTQVGLGKPRNRGNYEEFMAHHGPKYSLSNYDRSHLNEISDLVSHKSLLYTDRKHLANNLADHLGLLSTLLSEVERRLGRENMQNNTGSLFDSYTGTQMAYNQTLALLDEIPGKKLTETIVEKLLQTQAPISPLELEMIISEPEFSKSVALDLNLGYERLRKIVEGNATVIREALDLISENYEPYIDKIEDYFDEAETDFANYLKMNSKKQAEYLEKATVFSRAAE